MKCSASQITSSVHNTLNYPQQSTAEDTRIREVATQFEALLVGMAMRPVMKALGPMGNIIGQQLSLQVAAGMSEPLYEQLRSQIG